MLSNEIILIYDMDGNIINTIDKSFDGKLIENININVLENNKNNINYTNNKNDKNKK